MKRLTVYPRFIFMVLLMISLAACDDPSTSLVVTYEEATIRSRPLRIIVSSPDGTISTATLTYGESSTFRSLYEGAYGVKAVVDESYTQELRQRRDELLVELAAMDVLGEQSSPEQRADLSADIDSLIEQVNETTGLGDATACMVEPESAGKVGIQVKEDIVGIKEVEVIDVYCK